MPSSDASGHNNNASAVRLRHGMPWTPFTFFPYFQFSSSAPPPHPFEISLYFCAMVPAPSVSTPSHPIRFPLHRFSPSPFIHPVKMACASASARVSSNPPVSQANEALRKTGQKAREKQMRKKGRLDQKLISRPTSPVRRMAM